MEFIRLPSFEKTASKIFSESDILELELVLIESPEAGALIKGGKGLRKIRRPVAGRGKSGGARVIYYYISSDQQIFFFVAYPKNEKDNLSPAELNLLTKYIQ